MSGLCLLGMAESAWAQQANVVVKDAAGGTVASGVDFSAVKDSLNGNTAYVTDSFTESAMTTFSDNTSFSIISEDGTLKKITAGAGMTAGNGAFFSLSTENTLTLDLSNVQFVGGKGGTDIGEGITGGAIFSAGSLTLTGSAIFGGTGEGEGNTANYGGALGAYGGSGTTNSIELNGDFQFLNNSARGGGAIFAQKDVDLSGKNTFTDNSANYGGAISAFNDVTFSGGKNTFTDNSASGNGGAISASNDVTFSGGKNIFTDNSAYSGGAISANNDVTFSGGKNTFTGNLANYSGGAISAYNDVMFSGGKNTFTDNSADEGGAISANNDVTFSGAGSVATFTGNKADGVNNDIYSYRGNVTIQDGGTYFFGGGIVATNTMGGKLTIGVGGQDGSPNVTFGSGSITNVVNFSQTDSLVSVVLNENNKTMDAGATVFQAGTATADATATMRFVVDSLAAVGDSYTGTTGDFSGFNANLIAQVGKNGTGIALATKSNTGITINISEAPTGIVHRYNSSNVHQNSADTFNGAFLTGNGDPATGDKIILTADANSTAMTTLSGVTALSIYSNAADTVRKITNTNATAGEGAFLSAEGDLTLNLSDVQFTGGKGATASNNTVAGGAFYSNGDLSLTGNAIFGGTGAGEGNTAVSGGALASFYTINGVDTGNVTLDGQFTFLNNFVTQYGGAIYALDDVELKGTHTFTGNKADIHGGAVYATNVTIFDSGTFTGNWAGDNGGAIYATNDVKLSGIFRFENNSADDDGGAIYATNVTIFDSGTFTGNKAGVDGGAIYADDNVNLSGTFRFENNSAGDDGGAIYATNVTIFDSGTFTGNSADNDGGAIYASNDVNLSGTFRFENNSAGDDGGAINAWYDVNLSGTFRFENNSADDNGGAIYADESVNLSGTFRFENNSAGDEGGAIYADDEKIMLTGQFDFINNTAKDKGGAIIAEDDDVILYGKDSRMTFIGNKIGNEDDGWENNDIWIDDDRYALIIKDGGTYSFGGGIHSDGSFIIGVDGQDGAPDVTLGGGSITDVVDFSLAEDGSTLNVVLNEKNKVDSWTNTTFNDGATVFQVSGTATGDVGTTLRYVLEDVAEDEIYLGATGDFSGFNSTIIAQITGNQPDGTFIAKKKNNEGIWLGVMNANGAVVRMNSSGAIYESDTFDEVFNLNITPPPATGDNIVLTKDVTAEKMVSLTGVTALNIYSNTADTVRTITMDSNVAEGKGAFLAFDGQTKLTLADMRFVGGKGATNAISEPFGGAFYSQGNMEVKATNVTFEDNLAEIGGAIGSDGDLTFTGENALLTKNEAKQEGGAIGARGIVTMSGNGRIDQNTASWYGGAISGNEVHISGRYEITNNSAGNPDATSAAGGAVSASNGVTFSGSETEIVFRDNTVTDKNGTVANDVDNLFGTVTIRDGGTYYFGGGIVSPTLNIGTDNQDGTPNVTFGANSISKVNDALNLQNATLTFELDANADSRDVDNPYIDATGATSVNIQNVTTDVVMEKDYEITAGKKENVLLVKASDGSDLSNFDASVIKDNNLWHWETYLSANNSQYWLSVVTKDPTLRFGNGYAAKDLYGWDFYDNNLSDAELRANINGATGEIFASAAHVQTQRMTYLSQMITNRTRNLQTCGTCPCDTSRPNLWFSSYGLGGSAGMHDNFTGYDYNSWGMMFGAEFVRDDLMKFGVFYAYGQSETEAVQSVLNSDDHTFGAYLQWNNLYLGGYSLFSGSLSFSDNEGSRWYSDAAFRNDYDSWMGLVYYEKGWETTGGMFGVLNPYISIQYMRYDADDFADAVLAVNDNTYDSFRTALGLRMTKSLNALCLTGGLAWRHEWLDENVSFTASTANGMNATIFGNGTGRDWAELTLGVQYSFANLTLSADYYLFANADNALHAGMGTLTWKF